MHNLDFTNAGILPTERRFDSALNSTQHQVSSLRSAKLSWHFKNNFCSAPTCSQGFRWLMIRGRPHPTSSHGESQTREHAAWRSTRNVQRSCVLCGRKKLALPSREGAEPPSVFHFEKDFWEISRVSPKIACFDVFVFSKGTSVEKATPCALKDALKFVHLHSPKSVTLRLSQKAARACPNTC